MSGPAPFTRDDYRATLRAARSAGWRFLDFTEAAGPSVGEQACLLRHDCDNDLVASLLMAEIEANEGVRSTYFVMPRAALYNLMTPKCHTIVRRILALGHWLGLHFDDALFREDTDEQLVKRVEQERRWLGEEFETNVGAISFHQPSQRILGGHLRFPCINAYDRDTLSAFRYISDSNMRNDGAALRRAFIDSASPLQVLVHPEWWTETPADVDGKWNVMLADMCDLAQSSLLEREQTFRHLRAVRISPPPGC